MGELQHILKDTRKHLLNGVSYMIPVVVSGGVLMAIALMIYGEGGVPEEGLTADLWKIGVAGIGMMVPVFSAYIAASIANRSGIAPGLIGGVIAAQIGAGFLGGILSGLIAGITAQYLKKIPLPAATDFLNTMSESNKIILGLIVGAMVSFDMGGPINKVAFSLMVATIGSGIYTYAGSCATAIMIPPMAMAK